MTDGVRPPMKDGVVDRFVSLVLRELGAQSARIAQPEEPEPANALTTHLRDGRRVDVVFEGPIADRAAISRRLQMMVDAFESALAEEDQPAERRRVPAISLREELRALAERARAADALVIDAHSPVTWATAKGTYGPAVVDPEVKKEIELHQLSRRDLIDSLRGDDDDEDDSEPPSANPPETQAESPMPEHSERALTAVRELPSIASLRKGGHLAHVLREDDFGWLARSFAGIYVLVLVFDHLFDELRAERAVRDSLPRIERLVLALPPLDPEPVGKVMAMRKRRRP